MSSEGEEYDEALFEAYAANFYIVVEQYGTQLSLGHPELSRQEVGKLLASAFEYALQMSEYDPSR